MKAPRIFRRGKYFWVGYYESGSKNEIRKPTGIPVDVESPTEYTLDKTWWKQSKHRSKLQSIIKDIEFMREAGARGYDVERRSKLLSLDELLDEFNAVNAIERDRERTPSTLHHRKNAIDFLKRNLHGRAWHLIDRKWILDMRLVAKRDLAPASLRGYFTVLKMMYAYAVREEYIRTNPFEGITITVPKKTPVRIALEDEKKLLSFLFHANRDLFDQVIFGRLTGLRVGDVCRLPANAISDGILSYDNAKAHRQEAMPISNALGWMLERHSPNGESLFRFRNPRTIAGYLQESSKAVGIVQILPHQLKRSYLQELAKLARPDPRTFDLLAHHAASVNPIAVDHYAGRDMDLMLESLNISQSHWLEFFEGLEREPESAGTITFAKKRDRTGTGRGHSR